MVLLSRLGCFVCSGDVVFLSRIIDPAAGVLAPFRARACRPFRAPAPHTYIQVLRGWGLPPSPFKGGLGTICVLMGWRGSSRGWAWHTLVLGFQNCFQIKYLNGFGTILASQAGRANLQRRLEGPNCALARPLSIKSTFWLS